MNDISPATTANHGEVVRNGHSPPVGKRSQTTTPAPTIDVPVFSVKLIKERDHETAFVRSPADAARVGCELLQGFDREAVLALALSSWGRLVGAHVCHVGTVDCSVASPREVFKFCLLTNARQVLLCHNHPSGNLEPSTQDVAISIKMRKAGEALEILLVDSVIVGFDGHYTSLREAGLI